MHSSGGKYDIVWRQSLRYLDRCLNRHESHRLFKKTIIYHFILLPSHWLCFYGLSYVILTNIATMFDVFIICVWCIKLSIFSDNIAKYIWIGYAGILQLPSQFLFTSQAVVIAIIRNKMPGNGSHVEVYFVQNTPFKGVVHVQIIRFLFAVV